MIKVRKWVLEIDEMNGMCPILSLISQKKSEVLSFGGTHIYAGYDSLLLESVPLMDVVCSLLPMCLSDPTPPPRDSMLTRLLREAMGSLSCRTVMIAHASAAIHNYAETLGTIQNASRIHRMRKKKSKVFNPLKPHRLESLLCF